MVSAARVFVVAQCALLSLVSMAQAAPDYPRIIVVPAQADAPTVPHPAFRGHPTRFKAIARDMSCQQPYFRWDMDGDGSWDLCPERGDWDMVDAASDGWYQDSRYALDCTTTLLPVGQAVAWPGDRRQFDAQVQATCDPGIDTPVSGAFPVLVFASVSTRSYGPFEVAAHLDPAIDPGEHLWIKRAIAIEDALWFQHKTLVRMGAGNTQTAYPSDTVDLEPQRIASAATMLWGLALNGHRPAYPTDTYQPADNVPAHFADYGERYETDPFTEDAGALLNWLILNLKDSDVASALEGAEIADAYSVGGDGHAGASNYVMAHVVAAFSLSGMQGVRSQVNPCGAYHPNLLPEDVDVIVQKLINTIVHRQARCTEAAEDGGWLYMYRPACATTNVDGSIGGWLAVGLLAAQHGMGIALPPEFKGRLSNFFYHNMKSHDVYAGSGSWRNNYNATNTHNPHLAGGLLAIAALLGIDDFSPTEGCAPPWPPWGIYDSCSLRLRYDMALDYVGRSWEHHGNGDIGWISGNYEHSLARYGLNAAGDALDRERANVETMAMLHHGLLAVGADRIAHYATAVAAAPDDAMFDWQRDVAVFVVNNQRADGSLLQTWCTGNASACGYMQAAHITGWSVVLGLSRHHSPTPPVAWGEADPLAVTARCAGPEHGSVTFAHEGSFTADSGNTIVAYQWLFDSDGSSDQWALFDGVTLAVGQTERVVINDNDAVVGWVTNDPTLTYTHGYALPRADGLPYVVAVRVLDDTPPPAGPLVDFVPVAEITVTLPGIIPAESCDGEDNDCDGVIDANSDGAPLEEACYTGPAETEAVGSCRAGIAVCDFANHGGFGPCLAQMLPSDELCDGMDNDCDGLTDEDFPTLGEPCDSDDGDWCEHGTFTCSAETTTVECVNEAVVDTVEICDNVDNDCDGETDEGLECGVPCAEGDCDDGPPGGDEEAWEGEGDSAAEDGTAFDGDPSPNEAPSTGCSCNGAANGAAFTWWLMGLALMLMRRRQH